MLAAGHGDAPSLQGVAMLSHPQFLKLCEELGRLSPTHELEAGMKVARGFADLGFEEFLLLPGERLLALYSGQITSLPPEHRKFFFAVPSPDHLVERIIRRNFDIISLVYEEQRSWRLILAEATTGKSVEAEGESLEECLAHGLMKALSSGE